MRVILTFEKFMGVILTFLKVHESHFDLSSSSNQPQRVYHHGAHVLFD